MTTARSSSGLLAALALLLVLAAPALGADDDLERRMREVASGLRCPVCQNLSVAESTSELARDMRALILDQLRAGKTPEEIRAYFVSKYGPWILLSPPARGIGLLVWLLPALAAVLALGGALLALRRWARRPARAPAGADPAALEHVRALVAGEGAAGTLEPEETALVETLRELEFDHRAGKLSAGDYAELRDLYERRAAEALARAEEARRAAAAAPPPAAAAPPPSRRAWRWATVAVGLFVFGVVSGYFLTRAVRLRSDGGSITGDFLTGTPESAMPRSAAALSSRDVGTLLSAGHEAIVRQDYQTAMTAFTRVLEIDPGEPTANAYKGLLLHRGGHSERALAAFDLALTREPTLAPALWGKGLVLYEALGRPEEAVRVWQTLLALKIADEDRKHVERLVAEARAKPAKTSTPAPPR
ncbi:MAG TPA: hypothetical protein DDZ42_19730 [Candidatus Rokubacteria bacterium]|nr:hypothetical protein [Candidatus Rokubacteria bacterium]